MSVSSRAFCLYCELPTSMGFVYQDAYVLGVLRVLRGAGLGEGRGSATMDLPSSPGCVGQLFQWCYPQARSEDFAFCLHTGELK